MYQNRDLRVSLFSSRATTGIVIQQKESQMKTILIKRVRLEHIEKEKRADREK